MALPEIKRYRTKFRVTGQIGEGAFGFVDRAMAEDGVEIAIKRYGAQASPA